MKILKINQQSRAIGKFKVCLWLFCVLLLQSCQQPADFYLLDQTPKRMVDYRGKWLIVNFWAEWCAPCQKEVPELNRLYQARESLNLEIIAVSFDPIDNQAMADIVQRWNISYPVMASDPVPVLPFGLPKSLPGNYIVNPEGQLVAQLKGDQTYQSLSKLLISLKKKSLLSE